MDLLSIESRVYTRLKTKVSSTFKTKYPNFTITTSDKRPATMTYPYVYVHEIDSAEIGSDLENTTIAGVSSKFQIDVYSDTSQAVTTETMSEMVRIMKEMRFSVIMLPENQNSDVLFRRIARFQRNIGDGDIL